MNSLNQPNSASIGHLAVVLVGEKLAREWLVAVLLDLDARLRGRGQNVSLILADDGSAESELKELLPVNFTVNYLPGQDRGTGTALVRGMLYADRVLKADTVVMLNLEQGYDGVAVDESLVKLCLGRKAVVGARSPRLINQDLLSRKLELKAITWQRKWCGIGDTVIGLLAVKIDSLRPWPLLRLPADYYSLMVALLRRIKSDIESITAVVWTGKAGKVGVEPTGLRKVISLIRYGWWPIESHPRWRLVFGLMMLMICLLLAINLMQLAGLPKLTGLVVGLSVLLLSQGIFTLIWMIYAWQHETVVRNWRSPHTYSEPRLSFSAIIPARHEEAVIAETIQAVADIDYPVELSEIIVVCRDDDPKTIARAKEAQRILSDRAVKVEIFEGGPFNKPRHLNVALPKATGEVVVIFDAEDQPSRDVYNVVNTMMQETKVDVVQSGVQLMNYGSRWFSALNVLEYYFWFKSGLPFLARLAQAVPLGGNTVFFRREWLQMLSGWDDQCLTEDADVGIRLARLGAKIAVTYDEKFVTQEETPLKIVDFIKQRSRWNQGFLQIYTKGDWRRLPSWSQRLLARYVLLWPFAQAALALYVPVALLMYWQIKLPTAWSLVSFLPLYVLLIQMVIQAIAFTEFIKLYNRPWRWRDIAGVIVTFIPYQLLLGISAARALIRFLRGQAGWEKTVHSNVHRGLVTASEYV